MRNSLLMVLTTFFINAACGQISNVRPGVWSDSSIWDNSKVPTSSNNIILNHDVTVDVNSYCRSLNLNGHSTVVNAGVTLNILGNYSAGTLAGNWRLFGVKIDHDTTFITESDAWSLVGYNTGYDINSYYCVYAPDLNEYFFSPYKCTYIKDNIYYVLPDNQCDWRTVTPFVIDTATSQTMADDLILYADYSGLNFSISGYSKKIKWFTSGCTAIDYFPAHTDTLGEQVGWSFDSSTNLLSLQYNSVYGNINHSMPGAETWQVVILNDNELIINACVTCNLNSGRRYFYKRI